MFTFLDIPFDRVTYRDGQLLSSIDMRDDLRWDVRFRALHTRYLHETWGIALGLHVTMPKDKPDAKNYVRNNCGHNASQLRPLRSSSDGILGNDYKDSVKVFPGYAVDGMGRDIVLSKPALVKVPFTGDFTETFVLSVMYRADSDLCDRFDRMASCPGSDLEACTERPVFSWQRPHELIPGLHVPLAKAVVLAGRPTGLDLRVRRYAHRLVRPHVGLGSTEPGRTGWREWSRQGTPLGLKVDVDTSRGGFIKTPYYFATLHGGFSTTDVAPAEVLGLQPALSGMNSSLSTENLRFVFITNLTRVGFTYRIILLGKDLGSQIDADEYRQWFISWIGIEPVTGAEPPKED